MGFIKSDTMLLVDKPDSPRLDLVRPTIRGTLLSISIAGQPAEGAIKARYTLSLTYVSCYMSP
jgi:hypothetical protein